MEVVHHCSGRAGIGVNECRREGKRGEHEGKKGVVEIVVDLLVPRALG